MSGAPSVDGRGAAGSAVRRIDPAEVRDEFFRAHVSPDDVVSLWAADGGVLWRLGPESERGMWCGGVGTPHVLAELFAVSAATDGVPPGITLPRGTPALVTGLRLDPSNDWEWMRTRSAPPVQPGEERVRWLDDVEGDAIASFLAEHSPRHSAVPGDADVRRWCGIIGDDGRLEAVTAWTDTVVGVPHLASVATRADLRGRGLGGAVTGWVTRRALAEAGVVTLGMYSDNDVARRMYHRLGFACDHYFTSGRVASYDV